jgi:hypothetical protein
MSAYSFDIKALFMQQRPFFDMRTGELIDGKFPSRLRAIITEWAIEHRDELLKDWDLAQREEPLFKIPGADK